MVTSQIMKILVLFWVDKMNLNPFDADVKVTVGMCVKNSGETVKDAVESVLSQDFPNELMELVIVDGNSSDKTLEVIRNCLKNTGICTKFFCENEGLGRARQIVVDNASGEYIVWVDGDMMLSRDFLKKQVEFMERHPEVGVAKGRYGTLTGFGPDNLVAFLEDVGFMLNTLYEGEANQKILATSGCTYRVKAIKQVGGFDPNIKGVGEDMDAESRLRDSGWKLHISSATFQEMRRRSWSALWNEYFWHGQGASRLFEKNRRAANLYNMFPLVALVRELFRVPAAYQLTRRKTVLFLPFHYIFKRIAWSVGFTKSFWKKRKSPDTEI